MTEFEKIDAYSLDDNVFKMIRRDWMLVSAGDEKKFNTMTAGWGGLGIIWRKEIAIIFVRKSRYTHDFLDENDKFSLTFFGGRERDALNILGVKSGRDCDKVALSGLTPVFIEGLPTFDEAELVVTCRKMYKQTLDENAMEKEVVDTFYADNDMHDMYIGEILSVYKRK